MSNAIVFSACSPDSPKELARLEREERVSRLAKEGLSVKKIVSQTHLSYSTVIRCLKNANLREQLLALGTNREAWDQPCSLSLTLGDLALLSVALNQLQSHLGDQPLSYFEAAEDPIWLLSTLIEQGASLNGRLQQAAFGEIRYSGPLYAFRHGRDGASR